MKRTTAIRTVLAIATRLHEWGGVIQTPRASWPRVIVDRLWLFGSTLHGMGDPNDVDLLWSAWVGGLYRKPGEDGAERATSRFGRYYGLARDPFEEARRGLAMGAKMVRVHALDVDGDVAWPRAMLYPTNDYAAELEAQARRAA